MFVVKSKGFFLCADGRLSPNKRDAFKALAWDIAEQMAINFRQTYGKKTKVIAI
jgi:hypothetical protein